MTFDFLALKTTSTAERRAEKERLKEEERAKAQAIEEVCGCFLLFSVFSSLLPRDRVDSVLSRFVHM